jgi:hypothetical protein
MTVAPAVNAQVTEGADTRDGVIDAFDRTCRIGFPSFETVARSANAAGWIERKVSVPSGSTLPADVILPRTFQRGNVTVLLVTPRPAFPGSKRSCQVTAVAKGKPDPRAYASAVAARFGLGAPIWQGKGPEAIATWRVANGTVNADIGRYHQTRSFSLRISD